MQTLLPLHGQLPAEYPALDRERAFVLLLELFRAELAKDWDFFFVRLAEAPEEARPLPDARAEAPLDDARE